jgi:choline dehydrogenase-like flavoprotein
MKDPAASPFDVLVVGSGASGGWAAKRLSEAGLAVALVDAGRPQSDANFTEHVPEFTLESTSGFQGGGGAQFNWNASGFGKAFNVAVREPVQGVWLGAFGECLARFFPSSACQNPTLTIMALAVRSTDYLLHEMKRGNL